MSTELVQKYKRKRLPHWLRLLVLRSGNFTCYWCGRVFEESKLLNKYGYLYGQKYRDDAMHVDHIHPVCKGGTDDLDNLVASCASCNLTKSKNIWHE